MAGRGRKPTCECGECKKCKHRTYMRTYYHSLPLDERRRMFVEGRDAERVRAADRARHHARKHDPEYQEKRRAVQAVNSAVRDGRMEREPCEVCGATERVEGHHDDYSLPLDVRWLCKRHHDAHHLTEAA